MKQTYQIILTTYSLLLLHALADFLEADPHTTIEDHRLNMILFSTGIKLMKTTSSAPKASKGQQNRVRWHLAYTLINNPSLLPYRKGALVDATANGTKVSLTKP